MVHRINAFGGFQKGELGDRKISGDYTNDGDCAVVGG